MPSGKANKPKLIAEKYSIDYCRRPLGTRLWKARWNYSALGLAAIVFASIVLLQQQVAFQAAPVSPGHASFGDNCSTCHRASWQTALRLVMFDAARHSVTDKACQDCHHVADHATGIVPAEHCAACHQEHRPGIDLATVQDGSCTGCHGQLKLPENAVVSFVDSIATFDKGPAGHPEFAILRTNDREVSERHGAREVAQFVADREGSKWVDRGGVKFSHADHLSPKGVRAKDRQPEVLTCANCHVADEGGQYMRPIVYEQHCQRCHPLRLSEQLSGLGEAPHGSVDEVYGFLRRARLAELVRDRDRAATTASEPTSQRDVVKMRLPAAASLSAAEEETIHQQADSIVFGREAQRMCFHCHHVVARGGTWEILAENPEAVNPKTETPKTGSGDASPIPSADRAMLPQRWFRHAIFDHRSHNTVHCSVCHLATQSSQAADILMPSIETCRTCHGQANELATGRVRSDCILCHKYHDQSQPARSTSPVSSHGVLESFVEKDATP